MHANPHVNHLAASAARALRHSVTKMAELGVGREEAETLITQNYGRLTPTTSSPEPAQTPEETEGVESSWFRVLRFSEGDNEGWALVGPNARDGSPLQGHRRVVFERKEDAVSAGIQTAREAAPSHLVIHKMDGQFQEERSYDRPGERGQVAEDLSTPG